MENREYGIDLLRFFATIGVLVLHIFGVYYSNEINGLNSVINYNCASLLEIIFMCSVNIFGMITGYLYAKRKNYKTISIIKLILTYLLYSFIITAVFFLIFPESIASTKDLLQSLFPFLGSRLWYIKAYIFVFFMIPYLNLFISNCDKKTFRILLGILFVFFSIFSCIIDFLGISYGYSCFWLIFCYFVGSYIKLYDIQLKKKIIFIFSFISVCFLFIINVLYQITTFEIIHKLYSRFISYTSPFIVLNSICTFLLFNNLEIKTKFISKLLNIFSRSSLAVYIIGAHGLILDNFFYPIMQTHLDYNPLIFLGIGLGLVLIVFICSLIIDIVRLGLEKNLKINCLIHNISNIFDTLLNWNCNNS